MPIRGLLFDKDGTLLDYHASWTPLNRSIALHVAEGDDALAEQLLVHAGLDRVTGRVRANTPLAVGTPTEIAAAFARALDQPQDAALAVDIDRLFQEGAPDCSRLVDGCIEALAVFRRHTSHLGIATSDSRAGTDASLAPHGILAAFDFVAAYDSGYGTKPGPGMVLGFCSACDLQPEEVVVIGDNLHDLEMGRSAGAAMVIGVLTGTSTAEDLAGHADMVYAGIADLAADHDFLARLA